MRKIFQSTIYQIVAIIILLVLPINILTLYLSNRLAETTQKEMETTIINDINYSVAEIDQTLSESLRSLLYLTVVDDNLSALSHIEHKSENDIVGDYLAAVKQQIEITRMNHPNIDLMYFYFPKIDFFFSDGHTGVSLQTLRKTVEEQAKAENVDTYQYILKKIDNVYVLVVNQQWNNLYCGVTVNLSRLLERVGASTNNLDSTKLIMDQDYNVITMQGVDVMTETNSSLEQLQQSDNYVVHSAPIGQTQLTLVEIVSYDSQQVTLLSTIIWLQNISVVLFILVVPLLLLFLYRRVIKPLKRLVKAIQQVEQGHLDYRIRSIRDGREFDLVNQNFNSMLNIITGLKNDAHQRELEKKDIQIQHLSQQIQPHFILNAMNLLYSYEQTDYPLIQKMVYCIAKYFRHIVYANTKFVALEQEMDHIENYFQIQKARLENLFTFTIEYEDVLARAQIPPLMIQNFAENAIKYALKGGVTTQITVTAKALTNENFKIEIFDNGEGIPEETLEKINEFKKTGALQSGLGVGIQNTIERLRLLYSDKGNIQFYRMCDGGTLVRIVLPLYLGGEQT